MVDSHNKPIWVQRYKKKLDFENNYAKNANNRAKICVIKINVVPLRPLFEKKHS